MDGTTDQKAFSENTKNVILIFFSVICWGIAWNELWHLSWKIINISPETWFVNLSSLVSAPAEKKKILEEAFKRGIYADFYWPHLIIIIADLILIPLAVGFYIGRHSAKNKYLNCFLITLIVTILRPTFDLFSGFDFGKFFWTIFFKGYLISPILFLLTSLGAFMGSFMRSHNREGLYLTIFREILDKRKKGFIFLIFTIAFCLLSIKSLEKWIEDILSPYYRYGYAPVTFNKNEKDYPLLQVRKPSEDITFHFSQLTHLSEGNKLALVIYFNNNSYLYRAVNTKLLLRQTDPYHFIATLWADNAQPIQKSVVIPHNCDTPVFTYVGSNWYSPFKKNSQQLPFAQTGREILNPTGVNLGDIPGIWAGTGLFVTYLKYHCSGKKVNP